MIIYNIIEDYIKIKEVKYMEPGILAAIISFVFPGIGQAITTPEARMKWIIVFVIYSIIFFVLYMITGRNFIVSILSLIVKLAAAYDAYDNKIDINSVF